MLQPTTRPRYFVSERDVRAYHPANHTGTTNYRLIGPETVGAQQIEVLLGAGDVCFFPAGAAHRFTALSEEPVRVLVMYAPPYLENPANSECG